MFQILAKNVDNFFPNAYKFWCPWIIEVEVVVVQQYLTCLASVTAPLPSAPLLPRTPGHQLQRTWQSLPSFLKFSATLSSPSGSSRTSSGALWYWEVWWLHRCWSQHGSRQPRKPCPLTAETDMGRQYNTPKSDTYTLWNWKPRKLCCKEGAFGKINYLSNTAHFDGQQENPQTKSIVSVFWNYYLGNTKCEVPSTRQRLRWDTLWGLVVDDFFPFHIAQWHPEAVHMLKKHH